MSVDEDHDGRSVKAVHGLQQAQPDPEFEVGLSVYLRSSYSPDKLLDLYSRFTNGEGNFDRMMRRVLWRAMARRLGDGANIAAGVGFKHLETFEIGKDVFIGSQAYLQGRFDGRCIIGDYVWVGPQCYFDARDLIIEDYVGWGPGAKVLGSMHTGIPVDAPIITTDLLIQPVHIEAWADIGVNATILPGVTVGKGAIVGANAVVNRDVPPFAVVAGVPAKFLHWREGYTDGTLR